ncbi:autotransporter outer membrane beta-barrel domain-containing protein [Metapseudomonas otitidis]|uniref:autotransporter family protein n=1 Tax=Metapseudomonas otitidis TaxID=319939 RepID=UPI0013F6590B|nr:autotransporter outer membrane beta-barrel domain-containing protein [Pseudomonas otitidis]
MQPLARRHHLAFAITLATLSQAAKADTFDITNTAPATLPGTYNGLTLTGSVNANRESLIFITGQVNGDLVNNADMTINGSSIPNVEGSLYLEQGGRVSGNMINNGKLISNGVTDVNVFLAGPIGGSFINNGLIENNDNRYPDSANLAVHNAVISGDLINAGTLRATGNQATALDLEDSTIRQVDNQGTIFAEGTNVTALSLGTGMTLGQNNLLNHGTLEARGTGATAARIVDDHMLTNYGTVLSDDVAVDISAVRESTYAQMSGLTSGVVAVKGQGDNYMWLEGGEIRGNITGMRLIEVGGAGVTLDSALINSRYLDVESGTLTLLRSGTVLNGDLETLSADLNLVLSNATDPNTPFFRVNGLVGIDYSQGSRVLITPKPNDFSLSGPRTYQLISANTWTNTPSAPESTSGLLRVLSHSFDGQVLSAEVETLSGVAAASLVANQGASRRAQRALASFSAQMPALAADDPVFLSLAAADAARTAEIAEQLAPESNGANALAPIAGLRLLESATQQRNEPAGDPARGPRAWVSLLDNRGHTGERDGARGFDQDTQGIALGLEQAFGDQGLAGVAYSHYQGNSDSHTGNTLDTKGHLVSLYAHQGWGPYFVDGSLSMGWFEHDSRRYITGTRASGDQDGQQYGASLIGGYRLELDSLLVEPRLGMRYTRVELDGYREHGSSAALKLESSRYESGEVGAGLRVAGLFPLAGGRLMPEASLMAWHDGIGDHSDTQARFLVGGETFTTPGVRQGRDTVEARLGVRYDLGDLTLGAGFSRTQRSDAQWNSAGLTAALAF